MTPSRFALMYSLAGTSSANDACDDRSMPLQNVTQPQIYMYDASDEELVHVENWRMGAFDHARKLIVFHNVLFGPMTMSLECARRRTLACFLRQRVTNQPHPL